jgi:hypothetical protein
MEPLMITHTNAGSLNIAYVEEGELTGWPAVLLHGFPYDICDEIDHFQK